MHVDSTVALDPSDVLLLMGFSGGSDPAKGAAQASRLDPVIDNIGAESNRRASLNTETAIVSTLMWREKRYGTTTIEKRSLLTSFNGTQFR
jgi:hypothetical protein